MKKITLFFCLIFAGIAHGQITQDTTAANMLRYDTAIVINLPEKFGLQRKATFTGFFYNIVSEELALRWRVQYFNNGELVSIGGVSFEDRMQIANQTTLVDMQGNVVTDTTGKPGPFMREFDFYKLIANRGTGAANLTINQLIIQAGMRPGRWKE